MKKILIAAGDASGDAHAADFVREWRKRDPELSFYGLGGAALEAAGVTLLVQQRDLAVGGLVEVLSSLRRITAAWRRMRRAMREERPELVVLVDSPDFNLPLARYAKRLGIPVFYYISPQVWAWRRGRVKKIAKRVDRLAVIFPFEVDFYRETGLPVDFVGHPLIERMEDTQRRYSQSEARLRLGLDPSMKWVALMPGSRRNELRHGLALYLDAAKYLHQLNPKVGFVLALAPTIRRDDVQQELLQAALPQDLELKVVEAENHTAVIAADAVLAKPGTVTVEISLLGKPFVVAGRAHPFTAFLMRRLVKVPFFTMANLIAGRAVVPELLQDAATPEAIAKALLTLLDDPAQQLADLAQIRARLGDGGAAARAVRIAEEMTNGTAGS